MTSRLFVIFLLGFSSGLPLALVSSTLQAWFASAGMSVMITGALSLVSFPYLYRFLWGPILDRYSLFALGKRRSWILTMQVLLALSFNLMAWMRPEQSPELMAALAFMIACFSATQDVGIDAHRAEFLPESEHGIGASLAVFGYRLALLLSGGLALVLAEAYGWSFTYRFMGLFMIPGMLAIIFSPEPNLYRATPKGFTEIFVEPLKELIKRPGFVSLMCFIFFYKLGEAFTTTTSGIVMPFLIQGLGFSLATIGYVNKIMGVVALLIGGLFAGLVLMRSSLYLALMLFGCLQAITNGLFILLALVGQNLYVLSLAVISDNLAAGMGSTAIVALFMRLVDKRYTATQFSILVAAASIPRIISGPLSASIQLSIGWVGLYQIATLLSFVFIPFLWRIKPWTREKQSETSALTKQEQTQRASLDEGRSL